jgi:hypothetical protein
MQSASPPEEPRLAPVLPAPCARGATQRGFAPLQLKPAVGRSRGVVDLGPARGDDALVECSSGML